MLKAELSQNMSYFWAYKGLFHNETTRIVNCNFHNLEH